MIFLSSYLVCGRSLLGHDVYPVSRLHHSPVVLPEHEGLRMGLHEAGQGHGAAAEGARQQRRDPHHRRDYNVVYM